MKRRDFIAGLGGGVVMASTVGRAAAASLRAPPLPLPLM